MKAEEVIEHARTAELSTLPEFLALLAQAQGLALARLTTPTAPPAPPPAPGLLTVAEAAPRLAWTR